MWASAVLLPVAFWLGEGWVEVPMLVIAVMLVLIVELLNSAIESAVDRLSFELHDLTKRAKDIASAAVSVSLIAFSVAWMCALYTKYIS